MSQYLLNIQRAIAQTGITESLCPHYADGWAEAQIDLLYGLSLGSEHAVQAQMSAWLIEPNNPYYETLDSQSDKGYCERVRAINNLMEKCKMKWTSDQPKRPGFYWAKQGNQKQIVEVTPNFNVSVIGHNITLTFVDFDMWSDSQIEDVIE